MGNWFWTPVPPVEPERDEEAISFEAVTRLQLERLQCDIVALEQRVDRLMWAAVGVVLADFVGRFLFT
jgi:hypothetical protein